jgi:hypothetical protein
MQCLPIIQPLQVTVTEAAPVGAEGPTTRMYTVTLPKTPEAVASGQRVRAVLGCAVRCGAVQPGAPKGCP